MKINILLALIFFSVSVEAESLIPMSENMEKNRDWINDPSEIAYFGSRCYVLYTLLGGYFLENGTSAENKKTGELFEQTGLIFLASSSVLSVGLGMSQESIIARSKMLTNAYGKSLVENKRLHNNVFHGYIESDLMQCERLNKDYQQINALIEINRTKK
ncbi:MAG: hypothetical protein K8R50_10370 [Betaproteobacteria bacterium]|nr:hypothetical protein [Betaproteobacteria bacterium]